MKHVSLKQSKAKWTLGVSMRRYGRRLLLGALMVGFSVTAAFAGEIRIDLNDVGAAPGPGSWNTLPTGADNETVGPLVDSSGTTVTGTSLLVTS